MALRPSSAASRQMPENAIAFDGPVSNGPTYLEAID